MVMLTIVLALFFGTFSGTVVGGLVNWWLSAQTRTEAMPLERLAVDPDLEAQIDQAAGQWATAHDQPAAASLVADKLRLAHALNQRLMRRHGRGWS
jgi:hypothetical protein